MTWMSILQQGHIVVAGTRYGLSHLLASVFTLVVPGSLKFSEVTATVHVEYTSHCVSFGSRNDVSLDFASQGHDRKIVDHRGMVRMFCFERHRWSLRLPAIVAKLDERRCYFTGHSNWLVVEDIGESGEPVEYEIFFRLRRTGASVLRLVIESAYVRDQAGARRGIPRSRRSIVRFRVLAAKILRGEPIRDPGHNSDKPRNRG